MNRSSSRVAFASLAAIVLGLCIGPLLYPVDPLAIGATPFTPPLTDWRVPLGTDSLGRDVLAGLIHGGRSSLAYGLIATLGAATLGTSVGVLGAYLGGWVDEALSRLTELFQVLPTILLVITLVALFQPSLWVIVLSMAAASWPATARLARAEALRVKHSGFVQAARAMGSSPLRIMVREVLPNAAPTLAASLSLTACAAMLLEAGLSFLGLSDPSAVTWGQLTGLNRRYMLDCWWAVAFPGCALFVLVLTLSLAGDALTRALAPGRFHR